MKVDDCLHNRIESDLGLNIRFEKGQPDIPVKNCWHYSTDGNALDTLFWDDEDFRRGINRIALLKNISAIAILAFVLMDNHVHFILYGRKQECDRFLHEFLRRTSIHISVRHHESHKLKDLPVSCQRIDTLDYLKVAICYVLKNPTMAGLPFNPFDYPWSSGPLMFRTSGYWSSPRWSGPDNGDLSNMGAAEGRVFFGSHEKWNREWLMMDGVVFPGEYVAYELAEKIFRTHKAFLFFLSSNKDNDIEAMSAQISCLSIPDQEMRQHRNEMCRTLFGEVSVRNLDTSQRILLAKTMRGRFNCSIKQISRICGLLYAEVKEMI